MEDRVNKIVVIDGQGGKMGGAIISALKKAFPGQPLYGIGTNSIATAAMLKAGASSCRSLSGCGRGDRTAWNRHRGFPFGGGYACHGLRGWQQPCL